MTSFKFGPVGLAALVCLAALAPGACRARQNIRIQVNNENLQNPPYLLEALKQAAAAEGATAATAVAAPTTSKNSESPAPAAAAAATSSIKEEAIEALLDLEPESVLRLSPEAIMSSVASHDNDQAAAAAMAASERVESVDGAASLAHELRKPQLPVTSSHLKRPAVSAGQLEQDALLELAASRGATNNSTGGGAKSRVSPSVMADGAESAPPAANLASQKTGPQPPDTWEASQVMAAGAANESLVPATVRRQYGHQTRTRITLGGGYSRNKQPVEPIASADFHEAERQTGPRSPFEGSSLDSSGAAGDEREPNASGGGGGGGSSGSVENSRLVEVPKRIVLPASVFTQDSHQQQQQQQQRPVASAATAAPVAAATRRRDSRCPANGVTSLEHPTACDKYFLCQDGQLSEHTCPNGLLYGTRDVVRDFCVHRWQAVCGEKSIPNPISSPGCRWQWGIFNVQGSPKCVPDFYECKEGQFEVRKCSIGGQVYDDKTKSCRYAEQVGCTQEALADFTCPADDQTNTYWPFPRYFLNERALIHCVNDQPQIIRCRDHERVDPEHLFCVPLNKSEAPPAEDAGAPEMTARRSTSSTGAGQKRERADKLADSQAPAAKPKQPAAAGGQA